MRFAIFAMTAAMFAAEQGADKLGNAENEQQSDEKGCSDFIPEERIFCGQSGPP